MNDTTSIFNNQKHKLASGNHKLPKLKVKGIKITKKTVVKR